MFKKKKSGCLTFICFLLIIGLTASLAINNTLTVENYTLYSNSIKSPIRVVVAADLHSTFHGKQQEKLVSLIEAQNADLLLMPGDMVDDNVPRDGAIAFLEAIQGKLPIYYSKGNHEYWSRDIEGIVELMEDYGVTVLADSYAFITVKGNRLLIAGADDPAKERYQDENYDMNTAMGKAFGHFEEGAPYKMLLAHRPERFDEYAKYAFDLVVSGHAHGGQARIPLLLNGLYAPNQGFFPKLAGGQYEENGTTMIVSRGLSVFPHMPRIFNPPELVVIDILPAE